MGKGEEFMEKQMIDLTDKLEGYEEYMTQNLDGSICKWEYKPHRSSYVWEGWFLEPKTNNWMVSASVAVNLRWEESLIDLATHTPYLINGVLTAVPKLMIPNEDCYTESTDVVNKPEQEEYTGASVNYYKILIDDPTSADEPYVAECNDIIEALGMSYAEGNVFKAVWRRCAARMFSMKKKGYDNGLYDAEKVVFFGNRLIRMEKKK